MFPPFPGFEELPLHVEVEYQGRKRQVVARLEQLPDAPTHAALVCSFGDAPTPSEWILGRTADTLCTIGNPIKYLRAHFDSREQAQRNEELVQLHTHRVSKLIKHVQGPFDPRGWGLSGLHAVELPGLPREPRIALLSKARGVWRDSWTNDKYPTPFAAPKFDLGVDNTVIHQWLQEQWRNVNSDVRFAWEWASWSHKERLNRSLSFEGEFAEVKQVMKWILVSSSSLWEIASTWAWVLYWQTEEHGSLYGDLHGYRVTNPENSSFAQCQTWLWNHFFGAWRKDWLERHVCVREFLQKHLSPNMIGVQLSSPPTMHEQLEARLELREWLQDKATPDEIETLLGEL